MLGVPASPGAFGWLVLALGVGGSVAVVGVLLPRLRRLPAAGVAAAGALALTCGVVPYLAWRFVEDLRVTTRLDAYGASAAGPIQAYLPGYLVEGAQRHIPRDATYAVAVASSIPWAPARAGFPPLAMETLFPRRSVADPARADYVVTWGIAPRSVAHVSRTWVVRPKAGLYAAVFVGRVRH
jgi:hypothetical protein